MTLQTSISIISNHLVLYSYYDWFTDDDVIYCDLAEDETLFQGFGDYQFDVYRQMKEVTR